METTTRVFLEGSSLNNIIEQANGTKFEGHWKLTILAPQDLSASLVASTVYVTICWLEDYCKAKVFDLVVGTSPDQTWSLALEEKIYA